LCYSDARRRLKLYTRERKKERKSNTSFQIFCSGPKKEGTKDGRAEERVTSHFDVSFKNFSRKKKKSFRQKIFNGEIAIR
jgi:hypothetical protein